MHPYIHAKNTPDKAAFIMASSGKITTYKSLMSGPIKLLICLGKEVSRQVMVFQFLWKTIQDS